MAISVRFPVLVLDTIVVKLLLGLLLYSTEPQLCIIKICVLCLYTLYKVLMSSYINHVHYILFINTINNFIKVLRTEL